MFKSSRHADSSFLTFSQDYYELPAKTIRPQYNFYRSSKRNNFTDVQSLYHDKASIYLTLNEYKLLTFAGWIEKCQPLRIYLTKDK